MKDKINLALIGAGFWGKNLARIFSRLGVLKVICDTTEEIIKKNSKKYPSVRTTMSFSDVLNSPEINAVAIATPAEKHYSMTKSALFSGKHVFVEKPLSVKLKEGEELVRQAKEKQKVLFVGHILQYHPAILALKSMLNEGQLGKLQYIYSTRLNLGKIRREENILWSFAPHDISAILSLVNEEPAEVTATGFNVLHPQIADTTITNLKFPSGVGAHIFVSWLYPFKEQKLVVVGSKNMAVFDDTAPIERKVMIYPHNITWKNGIPISKKMKETPLDISRNWEEPLLLECTAFIEAIQGQPAITDGEEGLRVLKVLHRAQNNMDTRDEYVNSSDNYIHETSIVENGCRIGKRTKVWHFSHILENSKIGCDVNIGQNVMLGPNVT